VFRKSETLSYQDQELLLDRGQGPQKVWLDLDYSPIVDDGGTTLGVIAIVVETTARVAANRELKAERTRLKQMYEQSPSFMALLEGPDHRFAIVNPAYRSLVGGRDVKGMTIAQALPEAIEQGYGDLLDRVFRHGEPYFAYGAAFDLPLEGDRTERRFVDFVYQPITNADGRRHRHLRERDQRHGQQGGAGSAEAERRTVSHLRPGNAQSCLDRPGERVAGLVQRTRQHL
jgi:PAS domain-containing protein